MHLPQFELSDWIIRHLPTTQYNLAESGIDPPDLREGGIDLDYANFYRKHVSGSIGVEETIAETFGVEPRNVLVTSSSSEAIYLVHRVLLGEADEVVVPVPNYPAQLKVPEVVRARLRPLQLSFDDGWKLREEEVEKLLSPRTRLISVTSSHNPTGLLISRQRLASLSSIAKDGGAWLLCDEAFREYGFERAPPPAATLDERAISLGTMSKFYGVGDIRIGWVLAEADMIKRLKQLKTWITSVNSHFGEYVAKQVLENHKWFVDRARRFRDRNLELVRGFMRNCQALKWIEPDGSLFCFPKILSGENSIEFCERLFKNTGVLLDPGTYFEKEGYLRLCFTQNTESVKKGLEVLEGALS